MLALSAGCDAPHSPRSLTCELSAPVVYELSAHAWTAAADGKAVVVLTSDSVLSRYELAGPVGKPKPLPPLGGPRPWDTAIAVVNGEVAIATVHEDHVSLFMANEPA